MDRVVAQTKYSRKQHKEFYMFHLFHRTGTVIFVGVLSLIMLILAISNTINKDFSVKANMSAAIFSWIMFAISLSFTPIMIITRINNVIKNETEERKKSTNAFLDLLKKSNRKSNFYQGAIRIVSMLDTLMIYGFMAYEVINHNISIRME